MDWAIDRFQMKLIQEGIQYQENNSSTINANTFQDVSEERKKINAKFRTIRQLNALGFPISFKKDKGSKLKLKLKDNKQAKREIILKRFSKTREKYILDYIIKLYPRIFALFKMY